MKDRTEMDSPSLPKELSWLSFNERVLQEAADKSVPIIQRVRYLGIFSNNLDEYFRVRVADVRRLAAFSTPSQKEPYNELLGEIQQQVMKLQSRFDQVYLELLADLRKRHIYLINDLQLDTTQSQYVETLFEQRIQPELAPIILDESLPLPEITEDSIYLAIKIEHQTQVRYALLEIPTGRLERFIQIPQRKGKRGKTFIVIDNIIRQCLPKVFRNTLPIDTISAYTIKLTRDAELELGEGISQSLIDKISSSLKRRRNADPVRFVYDAQMPADLLDFMTKKLGVGRFDSVIAGGPYHNSKDFIRFPNVGPKYLDLKPLGEIPVPALAQSLSIFEALRERDILLYYPYHSFSHITNMLKSAAIDPQVKSIKISLYRVAQNSHVVDALLNAVRNHKEVTAIVELQARFDEAANIDWAHRLTEGGVHVIFGVPGLKVHSKLILITRQENTVQRYYSHIGTGNFNEKTATLYTDFSLLTYDQEIGQDVANTFDFIEYTYKRPDYKHLLVSPHSTRSGLFTLIEREISNAQNGFNAGITLKCNNLADSDLVSKLYEASQAGVEIKLIVRGMCSLIPGIPGISDNIQAISIVDRYLEHPRVYLFHNDGDPLCYISSADLMTRNLDYRVEVSCPIYDPALKQQIIDILEIQWHDNVKARIIDQAQNNSFKPRHKGGVAIRSQEAIHRYLKDGKLPRLKSSRKKKRHKNKHATRQ